MKLSRNSVTRMATLAMITAMCLAPAALADDAANSKDPGQLTGLSIYTGVPAKAKVDPQKGAVLDGNDARVQLVVTAMYTGDLKRDLTASVTYKASPDGIVSIDANGMVTPVGNGTADVTVVGPEGKTAVTKLTVADFDNAPQINFPNKIVPIFTKYGCNGGGCHGKKSGQNGFRLSLLGFEPPEDFEFLVKEGRGRRLFPAAPDNSLLLLKATNIVPHGGGERLKKGSHDYRMVRSWIAQGMPYGPADAPRVVGIEVFPKQRVMGREADQQLSTIAYYSDGSIEDVTHTAQYEPNDKEMAEVGEDGKVKLLGRPGDVAVMVRYQSHVDVYRATIPLGAPVENLPPAKGFVDELVFKKLKLLGMPPSAVADDATFFRRVTVDITGRIPTLEETQAFLDNKAPDKRAKWIDHLLASTDYADYFANKWSAILRNKRRQETYAHGTFAFHDWIRQSLYENKPYDKFVRDVLAASGDISDNPPVAWYREVDSSTEQLEDMAQLFLGLRLQCAKCHHHPFEKWSQNDYYGMTAFFSRVGKKNGENPNESRIFHQRGQASANNPKTGQSIKPTPLGGEPLDLSPDTDPRQALSDWLARPDNPFFARALVNRYWKHFFGRGLVDPEDDMRETNPAANPELLNALAQHFINSGFDMKDLVRTIANSTTYQLSAEPNGYNKDDKQNFSRYYPRRLNAEVLLDAIDQVTDRGTQFNGLPADVRAVQIPDSGGVNSYFLTVFGKPEGSSVCECERTNDATLAQSLHLLNSKEVQDKITSGRARALAADKNRSDDEKITELYKLAFSRPPVAEELALAKAHLAKYEEKDRGLAYEDIVWALINTKEFLFNH